MDTVLLWYLLFVNFITAVLFCEDKRRAKNGEYRIPERVLWLFSLLGGATFGYLAMLAVRHKTKHFSFAFLMPILSVIQVILALLILN